MVAEVVSSLFAILRFLLYLKFGPMNCLKTGSRKDRNMFNDLANLRIFHRRKRNKYCSKDPYFLCCKTLRNGIEVRQDLYLSVRTLSKLSPFGNLSHRVYCLADFFFRRRRLMSISGVVVGKHRFHDIKNCIGLNCLSTPFQVKNTTELP